MQPQGWYPDPEGTHAERWFSDGHPTDLVHDQGSQSYHEPPRARPPEWRWWTVVLPGLLALALAGAFLLVAALDSALNCFDGCGRITQGMPVGAAGEIIVAIAAAALLVAGLTTPFWRRAFAAGLWTAVALACVCAALIATARSAASVGPAAGPSAPAAVTPALNAGACTAIGGRVVYSNLTCFGVPYLGDNGQRDYGEVWYSRDGQLTGPAHTVGTGATQAECESGKYLHGPGSVPAKPGHWNAQLSFCMP